MVEPVTVGSSFLTSTAGQGLAAAAGGFLGSGLGGTTNAGRQRDARFNRDMARDQIKWQDKRKSVRITRLVADAKKAGLHPLAALGISPSSGGGSLPGIAPDYPNRSPAGSAIEQGIQVMQGAQRFNRQTAHQTNMAELQVEEQILRNDWLKSQILNSETKRLAAMANAQRPAPDPAMRRQLPHKPGIGESRRPQFVHPDGSTYSVQGGTPTSVLEEYIGEWGDWMPRTLGTAYDVMKAQWRDISGIDPKNTFYDKYIKKGYRPAKAIPLRNVKGKKSSRLRRN